MNTSLKKFGTIAAFFALFILGFTSCEKESSSTSDTITIGAIFSLTGNLSSIGTSSSIGAQLAVDQINAAGGINGQSINMVLEDSKTDTNTVREAVGKILEAHEDAPILFGLVDTDLARAAGKESAKNNRVFLTSGATSPLLPQEVPDYLYLACFGDNVQAAAAAEWAYNELNARTVSVVYDSVETYTILLHRYFIERFESLGGQVLSVQAFAPSDMSQVGQNLPNSDFIFLSAEPTEARIGISQIRAAGIDLPIVGGDGFDSDEIWEALPTVEDIYFTTHIYLGADNPNAEVQAFSQAYQEVAGGGIPDAFAALAYDAVYLIADAIGRADTYTPEAVKEALASTSNLKGVTGSVSFTETKQIPQKSVSILQIVQGERKFVKEFMPESVPD